MGLVQATRYAGGHGFLHKMNGLLLAGEKEAGMPMASPMAPSIMAP